VLEEVSGGFSVTFVRENDLHGETVGGVSGGVNQPDELHTLIQLQPGLSN